MESGYYRHPTIFGDQIVFVSEDDLWSVSTDGGIARRLTAGRGRISRPCFSRDGQFLAFSSYEEGALEVYAMPSQGGGIKRLTYLGGMSEVIGWSRSGEVIFNSNAKSPNRMPELYQVNVESLLVTSYKLGPGTTIDVNEVGEAVMARNSHRPDPAHWKRYRGGTAGQLWTAPSVDGKFSRILETLKSNPANPQWYNDRIYFLSDHDGFGNIYSCDTNGGDLKTHTRHRDFYARNLKNDGHLFVYHAGADIYVFDPKSNSSRKIEFEYQSQRTDRQRRFVSPTKYWESLNLSPDGKAIGFGTRGQVFSFANWQGPVYQYGHHEPVRYRLARWLSESVNGTSDAVLAAVCDFEGKDQIEIFKCGQTDVERTLTGDFGHIQEMKPAPNGSHIALCNHRNELIVVDIKSGASSVVAKNDFSFLHGRDFCWSPDSLWIAFCLHIDSADSVIQIYNLKNKKSETVTRPGLGYIAPTFDPNGEYLYFISHERLTPFYSDVMFHVTFPQTGVPCVLPLKKETLSPFLRAFADDAANKADGAEKSAKKPTDKSAVTVEIDFTNIEKRVQSFPIHEGLYAKIIPTADHRVFYLLEPLDGLLDQDLLTHEPDAKLTVKCFDFKNKKEEDYLSGVTNFGLSADGQMQFVRVRNSLQVTSSKEKPKLEKADKDFNAKSGWVDLKRVKPLIDPANEWRQMYCEAWRLQRDHFWVETMSNIDWQRVFDRYFPLLDRINTRSEFSDLVWEMQGELGTSHAYEMGGDFRSQPNYTIGQLGADFKWSGNAWQIEKVYDGEITHADRRSPLLSPGLNVEPGDQLTAIDGQKLNQAYSPGRALLHRAESEVEIELQNRKGEKKTFCVKPLRTDTPNRYRDWVETNRHYVHEKSNGKIGYLHIPNMVSDGMAEFLRNYLREYDHDGLIVDARYNAGGNVSQLILDFLARRRVGFDKCRWTGAQPYPSHSPAGPMVALTNQYAGSDGDIFPHAFKLMKLGTLIGQRTWGGVIGIWPRNPLVDGGMTSQPEFSFWFSDVGWGVENYGTDPDIVIDVAPHEFRDGVDPQLDRGIAEVLKLLKEKPPFRPRWSSFPDLSLPTA